MQDVVHLAFGEAAVITAVVDDADDLARVFQLEAFVFVQVNDSGFLVMSENPGNELNAEARQFGK